MDAVSIIINNLDVESVLEHYHFEKTKASGNYVRACCKLHEGSNSSAFVINYESGLWSCHTGSCGSGSIFQLVQKLEGVTFPYAVHKLAEILKIDITDLQIVAKTQEEKKELRRFLKIMNSHKESEMSEYIPQGLERKITKFKDFSMETVEYFGLKYFDEFYGKGSDGKIRVFKKVVGFPIVFDGKTVGISLRVTLKDSPFRWIHQPPEIKTGEILYNYDNVIGSDSVVVVEGITDAWAYHEIGIKAVATYGARITDVHKRLLLQLGSDLVFSYDGDEAGRETNKKAHSIFKSTTNMRVVDLPDGQDPASIKREELRQLYEVKL